VAICLQQGADCLHMVQLMSLLQKTPTISGLVNPDWFYLSGNGLPRSSWNEAIKRCSSSSHAYIQFIFSLG